MSWVLRQTLRRLRRGWRSGELLILALALAICVAAATAVGVFSQRVRTALMQQSGDALGADLLLTSRDSIPGELQDRAMKLGLASSRAVNLPTVLWRGDASTLAGLKAADSNYPLRGHLRTAAEPYAEEVEIATGPPAGEAWADPRLWSELQLKNGDRVQLGSLELPVTRLLTYEPDRGAGFADLAPRLLINSADLDATGLIVPGSRARHALMLAGPPDALAEFSKRPLADGIRQQSPQEARPEIGSALDRAESFLDLAALAASLLAAAAIGLCAHQHGLRLRDEVALLRCLGAGRNAIFASILLSLMLVGLGASVLGALGGFAAQSALDAVASALMVGTLPAPGAGPAMAAIASGLLLLLGFSLPPVLSARDTPPIRVFQRSASDGKRGLLLPLASGSAVVLILALQIANPRFALFALGGAAICAVSLGLLAALLVRLLAPLRRRAGSAWRLGLGNVARRRAATIWQCVALGLGLLALLLLAIVHRDLLDSWRGRLPADTPNQFLINIQSNQVPALQEFLELRGIANARLWPMSRARLVSLNGVAASALDFEDPDAQRWVNRDFNLSWSDTMQDGNQLIAGQWWSAAEHGQPLLSITETVRDRLQLDLGDTIGLSFTGRELEFEVRSIRRVDWETFRPNFFMVAAPGVLEDTTSTWLTSFFLEPDKRMLLRDLVAEFPNVTALDLDAMMQQVRAIMDRIVGALEFVFGFTLAAGLTVLLAAIEATRDERIREVGLLRALGASRRKVSQSLIAEYATLGTLAGLVAALAAQLIGWTLASQVFEIEFGFKPSLFVAGALGGAGLVALLGWVALRPVMNTPPHQVLRRNQ